MLAYAALPVALHFVVPEMLAARGVPASVGWGYVDLWSLELVLSRLRVGPPEGPGTTFDEFRANLARDSLAEGRIELENLRLRGASVDADSLDAAPFSGPDLPFPKIEFQDLRLTRLSEKVGRDVVVRHARLNRESPPAQTQKGLALELEVDAGGAPLELSGMLREDDEMRSFEGSLSASGVSARLLDPSPAEGPSTWSGTVYAVADFEIRHDRPDSRTSLRAEGDLITTGLAMHAGGLAVAEADSVWKGMLTLSGPALGIPQRVYFQGTLDVSAARVEDASGASGASVSGFHWDGIGGWHGVPVAAGEGSAESVEYFGRLAGDETMHVDLDRVQLRATLDDSGRYRLERLRARSLRARPEVSEAEIRAQSLEGREIQMGSDGLRVERVAAANLVALGGEGSEARRWSAERPVLRGVAIDLDARARATDAVLESLAVRGPTFRAKVLGARMEALRLDPGDRLEVGLASLEALEHRSDEGRETRIRNLRGASIAVDREGALEARELQAARIAASHGESGSWTGYNLATKRLRLHSGITEAGEAALDTLVYRTAEGGRLEAAGLLTDALELQSDAGAAERLEADSLRFEATRGAFWEARALSLSGPKWRAGADASVARGAAARLRYRSPDGERWRFAELDLRAATRDPEGAYRIAHAGSEKASVTLSSGEALEALGVRSGTFERNPEGAVSVADLGAETLALSALSGVEWRALPVEVESLLLPGEGRVGLRRLRSGSLSLHDGEGGRWQANGIAARSFDWHRVERWLRIDPLELERLAFTSARGVDWHADALFAEGVDWPRGQAPRVGNAAAARFEGKAGPGLAFRLDELQATGDESGDAAPSRLRVLSAGAGHLESTTNASRFSWSAFRATDLHVGGAEDLAANRVVVEEASLDTMSPSDAGITASRVEIADFVRDRGRMAVGTVTLEDSVATLGVDESGEWALPDWPRATRPGPDLAVEIGVLASGGHNRAVLVDRSVDPPLQVEMEPYRLRVSGIDTLNPSESARLEIGGTIDAGARLEVEGEFRAARRGLDTRARLRLRDFDFTRLSEYARRHLDVLVRAGTGDFDADLELSGGEMSAEGEVVVRELSLEAVEADASAAGATLVEAVRRLDEPGRGVTLQISLHGPVSDPGFDLPAATGRAIATSAGLDPGPQDPVPSSASAQE